MTPEAINPAIRAVFPENTDFNVLFKQTRDFKDLGSALYGTPEAYQGAIRSPNRDFFSLAVINHVKSQPAKDFFNGFQDMNLKLRAAAVLGKVSSWNTNQDRFLSVSEIFEHAPAGEGARFVEDLKVIYRIFEAAGREGLEDQLPNLVVALDRFGINFPAVEPEMLVGVPVARESKDPKRVNDAYREFDQCVVANPEDKQGECAQSLDAALRSEAQTVDWDEMISRLERKEISMSDLFAIAQANAEMESSEGYAGNVAGETAMVIAAAVLISLAARWLIRRGGQEGRFNSLFDGRVLFELMMTAACGRRGVSQRATAWESYQNALRQAASDPSFLRMLATEPFFQGAYYVKDYALLESGAYSEPLKYATDGLLIYLAQRGPGMVNLFRTPNSFNYRDYCGTRQTDQHDSNNQLMVVLAAALAALASGISNSGSNEGDGNPTLPPLAAYGTALTGLGALAVATSETATSMLQPEVRYSESTPTDAERDLFLMVLALPVAAAALAFGGELLLAGGVALETLIPAGAGGAALLSRFALQAR